MDQGRYCKHRKKIQINLKGFPWQNCNRIWIRDWGFIRKREIKEFLWVFVQLGISCLNKMEKNAARPLHYAPLSFLNLITAIPTLILRTENLTINVRCISNSSWGVVTNYYKFDLEMENGNGELVEDSVSATGPGLQGAPQTSSKTLNQAAQTRRYPPISCWLMIQSRRLRFLLTRNKELVNNSTNF